MKMKSIQDVGIEILENNPAKFYVFVNADYGIQEKYIDHLNKFYGNTFLYDSYELFLGSKKIKSLIPQKESLYVIRYDHDFIKNLNARTENSINKLNIHGTLVMIYSNKDASKLNKYLSSYTTIFDPVSKNTIIKYLKQDYSMIPDTILQLVAKYCIDYGHAIRVCESIKSVGIHEFSNINQSEFLEMFFLHSSNMQNMLRLSIIRREYSMIQAICNTIDDKYKIFYEILNSMVELDRIIKDSKYDSPYRSYINLWSMDDIYTMYCNTYEYLKKSRQSNVDISVLLDTLMMIIQISPIPKLF